MSGQKSRRASNFNENEINDLVSKLQALLPRLNRRADSRVSVSKVLKETCSHIKKLQKEVEELSEKLIELMDSADIRDIDEESLRRLLLH
ncbi:transcription factor ILI4-like [Neltuma alba]|uniref:transcription factor ILI4-like n=1 Tax=Neltuma alba TaxID=207710 RepID=UPI0010A4DBD5|nr:transcription factor ILI4-like [Prosopis alba]